MAMVRAVLYECCTPLLVNTGNRLVNFWQKFGKQWELESVLRIKRTVGTAVSSILVLVLKKYYAILVVLVFKIQELRHTVQDERADTRIQVLAILTMMTTDLLN